MSDLSLRFGLPAEREHLEELQRRASLMHDAYREALLANPDLIALPRWQLEDRACAWRKRTAGRWASAWCCRAVKPRFWTVCSWNRISGSAGIGRALIEDAFGLARDGGAEVMEVLANPYADGFYARLGFVRTGTVTTPLGIGSKMRRLLRQT